MARISLKKPRLSRSDLNRRADDFLHRIQPELMPHHASDYVAINLETGEYVLGSTPQDVFAAFRARWPNHLMFRSRVDGGPAVKFYGK